MKAFGIIWIIIGAVFLYMGFTTFGSDFNTYIYRVVAFGMSFLIMGMGIFALLYGCMQKH